MIVSPTLSTEYYSRFLEELEYPEEAVSELSRHLELMLSRGECAEEINAILAEFLDESFDYTSALGRARELFKAHSLADFPSCHAFVAHLFAVTRQLYKARGTDDSIFIATAKDLRYKAVECKLVEGVWGTFVPGWYSGLLRLKIFALGRLQYEKRALGVDVTVDGVALTKDTPALYIHIPRSEERLEPEATHRSYKMAAEFFGDGYFGKGPKVFTCSSWLLFPEHNAMLKPESNIRKFMADFTTVSEKTYENHDHLWRIFDKRYTGDPDTMPCKSSIHRAYLDKIRKGEPLGSAHGVFIYK